MSVRDLLETHQPVAYKTLFNGFNQGLVSHAYLLVGESGSPLFETAQFIAQSYLCDQPSPLACENCMTCHRVEHRSYADLIIVGEDKETIKKEHIEKIQEEFSKTALEDKGKKVYILHLIEKATPSAMNSLLKFLEEPAEDVLAILTTEEPSSLLSTIASRCQTIRLKGYSQQRLKEDATQSSIDSEDAALLAQMVTNVDQMKEMVDSELYQKAKDFVIDWLDLWNRNEDRVMMMVQQTIEKEFRNLEAIKLIVWLIEIALKDLLFIQQGRDISFVNHRPLISELAKKTGNLSMKIQKAMKVRHDADKYANIPLLMDRLLYEIYIEE